MSLARGLSTYALENRFASTSASLILLLSVVGLAHSARGQSRFAPALPYYEPGGSGALMAVEDFNHDGYPDALVLTTTSTNSTASLSLLAGDGHGGFGTASVVVTNISQQVIPGDFNGDGIPDIAVIHANNTVQIYLNNGNGTFTGATPTSALSVTSPVIGTVGDFDGNGHLDLVVADQANNRILVLPGDGHGHLGASIISTIPALDAPGPMIAADLNGDGRLDLALTNSGAVLETPTTTYVQLMSGDGKGHFVTGAMIPARAASIYSLDAADLNGDGKIELVLATGSAFGDPICFAGTGVAVLASGPSGDWAEKDYPAGTGTSVVAVADMNHDGLPDIVSENLSGSFSVLLNQGPAAKSLFAPPLTYGGPNGKIFVRDVTGDGNPDIIISTTFGIEVEKNLGNGHFMAGTVLDDGLSTVWTDIADINHDGIPDLVYLGNSICYTGPGVWNGLVSLVSENGQPLQTKHRIGPLPDVYWLKLGDLDGDGNLDALLAGFQNVEELFNDGRGNFGNLSHPSAPSIATQGSSFALGDFNGDRYPDFAHITGNTLQTWFGTGGGQFGSEMSYLLDPSRHRYGQIGVADVNHDGRMDLVFGNPSGGYVEVFLANGDGTFREGQYYAGGVFEAAITLGDINGDGNIDILLPTIFGVTILPGKGDGTFSEPTAVAIPGGADSIAVADLRGNGINDLIVIPEAYPSWTTYVLSGDGKGGLGRPVGYFGVAGPVLAADFNGDGAIDLLETGAGTGPLILYNQGGTRIALTRSASTIIAGSPASFTAQVSASVEGAPMPTGAVKFYDGNRFLSWVILHGGEASFSTTELASGTHYIKAIYEGSNGFNAHTSTPVAIFVKPR